MFFHSLPFVFFFLPVFLIYWVLNHQNQNRWLLLASYLFYGFWDWRLLGILIASSVIVFQLGHQIAHAKSPQAKSRYLILAICFNLFLLCVFKYLNFFLQNVVFIFHSLGGQGNLPFLKILLPLGISFYTFKAMSYCVDIYRGSIPPATRFFDLALYLAFFPQLISGPIDRSTTLLPQIQAPRKFLISNFYQGCFLIFWGLFQKLYVADNLGLVVDPIFDTPGSPSASQILLVLYAYAFQLYYDFLGYSNMAWGLAKVLGFDTTHNFNLPFFATNIQSFWNRWHISLSLWIRDYLYTPIFLAAHALPTSWRLYSATLLSMFCIGLWHGAGWHYVLYGVYHGILLCLYFFLRPGIQKLMNPKNLFAVKIWEGIRILFVFHLVAIGFLIFRAHSCRQFFEMMQTLFLAFPRFSIPISSLANLGFLIALVLLVDFQHFRTNDRFVVFRWSPLVRAVFYIFCFFMLSLNGAAGGKDFIYFQF